MRKRFVAMTGGPAVTTAVGRQQGFSLLELLVVLIVIVLFTSMANLTVNSGGQDVELQAKVYNLADVASYALDEAQITGVDYGLLLQEDQDAGDTIYSYLWLERRLDGWSEPVSGKELFKQQRFPPGIALELELEDSPLVDMSLDDNEVGVLNPQVVFYASGETTVGAIEVRQLEGDELLWRIEWDLLGRFDVLRRGEAEEDY
jgi:prepilin-type N-terminal cleavage/methylation domain-containing protein